jgi:RNA polymerase sigma-70 factor (ECF subfamily)
LLGEGFDEVLLAARRGDEWAWTTIYRDLAPTLLGWLRSQRAPSAEDVTAEVLLQVVRDLSQFAGDEQAFRSWVFTVARNRTIDSRRHDARRPSVAVDEVELQALAEPAEDAALAVVEALDIDELVRLLERLTDAETEVLTLRYVAGLSQREVADVTGKALNNVKQIQKRGLRSLRVVLGGVAYPSGDGRTLSDS